MRNFKSIFSTVVCICLTLLLKAQPLMNIAVLAPLPDTNKESSGLERTGVNCFWSHNDSGGQPELYNFDSTGTLLRILRITNGTNVDWEELTRDTAGNMYIGDFGNNNCDRQDLVIYKISNPDSIIGNSTTAEAIHFSYPDQYAFPPHPSLRNFDMEAMITIDDSLYLFTKNQTSPSDGYTKVYRLPLDSGTYVAQLVDSFLIGTGSTDGYSVTGARITSDYDTLLLISHERLWIFSGFTGTQFFSGSVLEYEFNCTVSNKEGICMGSGSYVYISDEYTVAGTQNLYYLDLLGPTMNDAVRIPPSHNVVSVYPNPFCDELTIQSASTTHYKLLDATGRVCLSGAMMNTGQTEIDGSILESGIYFLILFGDNEESEMIRLIKTDRIEK